MKTVHSKVNTENTIDNLISLIFTQCIGGLLPAWLLIFHLYTIRTKVLRQNVQDSETCIKRPRLGQKKWSLNRGGLLIEVKRHRKATIGT